MSCTSRAGGGGGDQRRDGCPKARHLFEPNYVKVWTHKFGQRLSMACGVDFVQTIVREDRLHSNVSNFSSYELLKIEC